MASEGAERAVTFGPVQLVVFVVEGDRREKEVLVQLGRLDDSSSIELLDLLLVAKGDDGVVTELDRSGADVDGPARTGRLVAGLIGVAADQGAAAAPNGDSNGRADVWYLADAIPPGASAVVALIEHRWAIPLRDAVEGAAGGAIVDRWVHPHDLLAIGADPV
jgi:hypothetical protein